MRKSEMHEATSHASASAQLADMAVKPLETISFSTENSNLAPVAVEG